MATSHNYRVPQPTIVDDRAVLKALNELGDYTPRNSLYNIETLQKLEVAVAAAEQAERLAQKAMEAARLQIISATWAFHNAVLSAKSEVVTQYGSDSLAVHAVGWKRKSEYKRPVRPSKPQAE